MRNPALTFNTRKSLSNHLGEEAGAEMAELIMQLTARIEQLERNKVDITPIAPGQHVGQSQPSSSF